jgi:predicted nuclease of predicted toxin-antitoxin system
MRFLVDAQFPPALARWLVEQGHEAGHVVDFKLQSAADREIWNFAVQTEAVILTKDEDFARRRALTKDGPMIVWVRLPNSRRSDLLEWFERALADILAALERGETIVEVI